MLLAVGCCFKVVKVFWVVLAFCYVVAMRIWLLPKAMLAATCCFEVARMF